MSMRVCVCVGAEAHCLLAIKMQHTQTHARSVNGVREALGIQQMDDRSSHSMNH